jgi:hypothetical protein
MFTWYLNSRLQCHCACLDETVKNFQYAFNRILLTFIQQGITLTIFLYAWYTNVRLSVRPFHMSRSNLRTPWPIPFKFHRVIEIDGLAVCILYGEISNFHSRIMGLYSSNCT